MQQTVAFYTSFLYRYLKGEVMKKNLLNIICCPDCHDTFRLQNAITKDNEVISGALFCQKCNSQYPILDGLPVIMKNLGRMSRTKKSFGKQWEWQNKKYFESDTIYGVSEEEELREFENILGQYFNIRKVRTK